MYDWRYENSITNGKKIDIDGDYSQWRINSSMSQHPDTVHYANEMNIYSDLPNNLHYDFLFGAVRKRKRWSKGESKEEKKAREKYEELLELISTHYKYNLTRAKEALSILTPSQIDIIKNNNNKGGVK